MLMPIAEIIDEMVADAIAAIRRNNSLIAKL